MIEAKSMLQSDPDVIPDAIISICSTVKMKVRKEATSINVGRNHSVDTVASVPEIVFLFDC